MPDNSAVIQDLFPRHKKVGLGEWAGPCPECGGQDRCRVFDGQGNQGIFRAWCRQCNMIEDALAIVQMVRGLSFADAHRYLGLAVPDHLAARAGLSQLEHQREMTQRELDEIRRARCFDLAQGMNTQRLVDGLAMYEPSGDPSMYHALVHTMASRLAGLELMAAMAYRDRRSWWDKTSAQIQEKGFPWWSFDALGIDQRTLDELVGSDSWAAGVKG